MASKIMVKMPVAPFGQATKPKSAKVNGDLVQLRQQEVSSPKPPSSPEKEKKEDAPRVAQLEQNIKFLQEQHQLMLAGLHSEIDNLRHRNRELQFQLVFVKGTPLTSPSSPEDDTKPKVYLSPKQLNITPLQVELLERELSELKLNIQEIESRNVYLSAIADEQKKKLERYERDRERERERELASQPDMELMRKLEDAEQLIRRLRQENGELRRERPSSTRALAPSTYRNQENFQNQRSNTNNSSGRGNPRHRGNYRGNWFPPLHSQSYWQSNRAPERSNSAVAESPSLPSLQNGSGSSNHYQQRRGSSNNNYHNNEGGRKYRGGQNRGNKQS